MVSRSAIAKARPDVGTPIIGGWDVESESEIPAEELIPETPLRQKPASSDDAPPVRRPSLKVKDGESGSKQEVPRKASISNPDRRQSHVSFLLSGGVKVERELEPGEDVTHKQERQELHASQDMGTSSNQKNAAGRVASRNGTSVQSTGNGAVAPLDTRVLTLPPPDSNATPPVGTAEQVARPHREETSEKATTQPFSKPTVTVPDLPEPTRGIILQRKASASEALRRLPNGAIEREMAATVEAAVESLRVASSALGEVLPNGWSCQVLGDAASRLASVTSDLESRVNLLLGEHEADFMSAFRVYMQNLQPKVENLLACADARASAFLHDKKINTLEQALQWFIQEAIRLDQVRGSFDGGR